MTNYRNNPSLDVAAQKSAKIEFLQRQVDNANTVVAKAEAKYNSFVEKAALFAELYNEAEAELETTEGYWQYFLQVKSDLEALKQSGNEANLVAVDALSDVRQLMIIWEEVTVETLRSAEVITLTADYIEKRKASNPLISDDLVEDAAAAAQAAAKAVTQVINAFGDALKSLSPATQAAHASELTDEYIKFATSKLLEEKASKQVLALLAAEGIDVKGTAAEALIMRVQSLEFSLTQSLTEAQRKAALALTASESANKEMNKAKEELALAKVALKAWQVALVAAETAVTG